MKPNTQYQIKPIVVDGVPCDGAYYIDGLVYLGIYHPRQSTSYGATPAYVSLLESGATVERDEITILAAISWPSEEVVDAER